MEFLGHRSDVHDLMRSAAIFVATRPDEAFGLSVVEAMARGLPVVAAGSGAHLETVGSVPGAALFGPGDSDEAARLLEDLAADVAAARRLRTPVCRRPSASSSPSTSRPATPTRPTGASCDRPRRGEPGGLGRRLAAQPAPGLQAPGSRPRPARALRRASRGPDPRPEPPGRCPGGAADCGRSTCPAPSVGCGRSSPPSGFHGASTLAPTAGCEVGSQGGGAPRDVRTGAVGQRPGRGRAVARSRVGRRSTTSPMTGWRRTARPASASGWSTTRPTSCSTARRSSSARRGCWRPSTLATSP